MRLIFGLTTGIVIIILIGLIVIPISIWTNTDMIVALGLIVVISSMIYFNLVFPYCTFNVPPDRAWIIANPFVSESADYQKRFSGYRKITAQKEFQAGFHWKYPWEKPNLEVDMSRQIDLQHKPEEVYTLKSGELVIIRWRIFYGPLPGSLVNFIKTRPEYITQRLRDRVEKFLQSMIGETDKIGFGKEQLESFKRRFEGIYGGPYVIDEEERNLGIWTGTPEILDIDAPRSAQEITAILKAATDAVAESKGQMTFEEARGIILASRVSGTEINVLELAKNRAITAKNK